MQFMLTEEQEEDLKQGVRTSWLVMNAVTNLPVEIHADM